MLDVTEKTRALILSLYSQHGEVFVRTSWWRRWLHKEEWVIAQRPEHFTASFLDVKTGLKAKRIGDLRKVTDPDLWPDEVCTLVMKMKLTQ